MKQFTTPGLKETKKILFKMKVNKAPKRIAYANLEAMRANLEKIPSRR
jgi:hypothetical protein